MPQSHNPTDYRHILRTLAERCEQAANGLDADADDPAGTLAARGYRVPDDQAQAFGQRHRTAADAARRWAQHLRTQAEAVPAGSDQAIAAAYMITRAAELGGILIDGPARPGSDPATLALRHALADQGAFARIADPGQVPFLTLTHPDQATPANAEVATPAADDADGW